MKQPILNIHERPAHLPQWLLFSLQHVFAMFGATILVPILTGLNTSVALVASGVATLSFLAITRQTAAACRLAYSEATLQSSP